MTAEAYEISRQTAHKAMDRAFYDMYIQCGYPIKPDTVKAWNERLTRTALTKVSTYLAALDELIKEKILKP